MAQNEKVTREQPTLQQIEFLMELEKIGSRRGCVSTIAEKYQVNHATVSRFFKSCCERGELKEDYKFTEKGEHRLALCKKMLREVREYLTRIGVVETEIEEQTKKLLEHVDYHVIADIIKNDKRMRKEREAQKQEDLAENFLYNVLEKGNHEVYICLYQTDTTKGLKLSMANAAFENPAILKNNNRGSWLELTFCEMKAQSQLNGMEMTGTLHTLKYIDGEKLMLAQKRDGKVRIPLSACTLQRSSKGNTKGLVPVTVTCSVGNAHMPESTAYLMFWL